ncbi:MAG: c-type cytochrome domain-containing protein [Planctomycetaceae bacterium]
MKSLIFLLLTSSFLLVSRTGLRAQDSSDSEFASLQAQYEKSQAAVLQKYCLGCHSAAEKQGELDLEQFHSVADMRGNVVPWQRVVEMMDDGEMPPKDAEFQPTKTEHTALRNWVRSVLDADAKARRSGAGGHATPDNAEFSYAVGISPCSAGARASSLSTVRREKDSETSAMRLSCRRLWCRNIWMREKTLPVMRCCCRTG